MKLEEVKEDLHQGVSLEMVLIPAGTFMMGSPESEEGRHKNETQHEVTLTKPFYIGKYEVTQEQWEAVMGKNPIDTPVELFCDIRIHTEGVNLPVMDVSWENCQEFIKKLNAKTDGGYRLPTEAEWEYACRAGTTTAYSVGAKITPQDANYRGLNIDKPVAVGSYKPNAFGLYDMHGNLFEWCEDWYGDYPAGAATDPKGPGTGIYRVWRGGSFVDLGSKARSSYRISYSPTTRNSTDGFRLARTADVKDAVAPAITNTKPAEIIPATGNLLVVPFSEAKAKEVQKAIAKSLQKEVEEKADLGKDVKLEMVLIPAGTFMMGSPESEEDRDDDETQHEVTLTKPFYMGKYEVTQEQWFEIMGKNPSDYKGKKVPVTCVSWNDCQEFIKKLNGITKGKYRLPTEAEWEYACRAWTKTVYSFGDVITPQDANYLDSNVGKPIEVGKYNPNAFGLYDMHGNVWEWCEDWYGEYPGGAITDPKGAATGSWRVLRGGAGLSATLLRMLALPSGATASGHTVGSTSMGSV